jgi:hypothetical protein
MAKHETVHTPAHDLGGHASTHPTGKVCVDGKVGPGLPSRTGSKDAISEVFYDENAHLPEKTGGK